MPREEQVWLRLHSAWTYHRILRLVLPPSLGGILTRYAPRLDWWSLSPFVTVFRRSILRGTSRFRASAASSLGNSPGHGGEHQPTGILNESSVDVGRADIS